MAARWWPSHPGSSSGHFSPWHNIRSFTLPQRFMWEKVTAVVCSTADFYVFQECANSFLSALHLQPSGSLETKVPPVLSDGKSDRLRNCRVLEGYGPGSLGNLLFRFSSYAPIFLACTGCPVDQGVHHYAASLVLGNSTLRMVDHPRSGGTSESLTWLPHFAQHSEAYTQNRSYSTCGVESLHSQTINLEIQNWNHISCVF